MSYRYDPDLEFLKEISSSDLDPLVTILTKDKDGKQRFTGELATSRIFQLRSPDHHVYWPRIAREIQCYGANSLATMMRGGKGVRYRTVLMDVCDKIKVNYNRKSATSLIEMNLLMKILEKSLDQMNEEQLREVIQAMDLKTAKPTPQAILAALQAAIAIGGFQAYVLAVIVANALLKVVIGRGLTFAGNAVLTRAIGVFGGPVGWVITGLWTVIDIAGPAYRVTVPACFVIAYLRVGSSKTGGAGFAAPSPK